MNSDMTDMKYDEQFKRNDTIYICHEKGHYEFLILMSRDHMQW